LPTGIHIHILVKTNRLKKIAQCSLLQENSPSIFCFLAHEMEEEEEVVVQIPSPGAKISSSDSSKRLTPVASNRPPKQTRREYKWITVLS
jgi:hypothetical protein